MKTKALLLIPILFCLLSCKNRDKAATELVDHWLDKEIIFPADAIFTQYGTDTVEYHTSDSDYKLLVYVDTMGCTSCKLQLDRWSDWIEYIERKAPYSVSYLFYFYPKDIEELRDFLSYNQFSLPVCIDYEDRLNRLNHFNKGIHVSLLDKNNRVVLIGNPFNSSKMEELYRNVLIPQKDTLVASSSVMTSVSVENPEIDLGNITQDSISSVFNIENTGENLYFISSLKTSCGCTIAEYDQEPIAPGKKMQIKVSLKKEQTGYFRETITVYSNTADSPIYLIIQGTII